MREWTREERYQVLESPDQIRELHERIAKSAYRQTYHVQPVTGLSSDPNGFVHYKGLWHLFYQWCPWGAVHGLKYWYHVTSEDLVHWKNAGIGLKPDRDYDNRGNHSGSGIAADGELYFFYTGNHRDENWVRTPYTCAAYLGEDGKPVKLDAPLFGPRDDYSEHQRDPKVIYNEEKDTYYILIGAQTLDKKGTILIYESKKLLEGWKFKGQLHVVGYEDFGGMWECPYIVNISGRDLLIFSPQYTKLPGRANSTNHNVYFIGKMDYDTLTFTPDGAYHYLDYGFDFYAAQGAANVGDPDKAILISWIGLPDNHYATEPEDWEGSMTLARELRIRDGKLYQTPIPAIQSIIGEEDKKDELSVREGSDSDPEARVSAIAGLPSACVMDVSAYGGDLDLDLYTKEDGTGGLTLHYDAASKVMTFDKTGMDKRFNEQVGEVLGLPLDHPLRNIQIFIDKSSTEYFINDGEATFTAHTYPTEREFYYAIGGNADVKIHFITPSVKDDFVV